MGANTKVLYFNFCSVYFIVWVQVYLCLLPWSYGDETDLNPYMFIQRAASVFFSTSHCILLTKREWPLKITYLLIFQFTSVNQHDETRNVFDDWQCAGFLSPCCHLFFSSFFGSCNILVFEFYETWSGVCIYEIVCFVNQKTWRYFDFIFLL